MSKYSSAGKLLTTMLEEMRSWKNPFWASVGQIIPYWATERLERSIFHKQDALSTLVNRSIWIWKWFSYYSSQKKKMATAIGRKRRRGQRGGVDGLQTITTPLFQVRFSQTRHLRSDERMIFPTMLSNTQCNKKIDKVMIVQRGLHKAQRFTGMIMPRRTRR